MNKTQINKWLEEQNSTVSWLNLAVVIIENDEYCRKDLAMKFDALEEVARLKIAAYHPA